MADPKTHAPDNLRYTRDHEWARLDANQTVTIGITDFAQDALGDITYVELPEVGSVVESHGKCGVVESVKTFSDVFSPVAGTVVERNDRAASDPAILNASPYEEAWLVRMKVASTGEFDGLMDAAAYRAFLATL